MLTLDLTEGERDQVVRVLEYATTGRRKLLEHQTSSNDYTLRAELEDTVRILERVIARLKGTEGDEPEHVNRPSARMMREQADRVMQDRDGASATGGQ